MEHMQKKILGGREGGGKAKSGQPYILMLRKIKVPTNLPRRCWAHEFTSELVPVHFYELPHEVPIRVREAWDKSHYKVSDF